MRVNGPLGPFRALLSAVPDVGCRQPPCFLRPKTALFPENGPKDTF